MYIEREALIKAVAESLKNNPHKDAKVSVNHITEHQHFARLIERQPAADVAPVVHGEWLDIHEGQTLRCSHCFAWVKADCVEGKSGTPTYCPHCGAKMDGGSEK